MKTYDIQVGAETYSLRLTNSKLEAFCDKYGFKDAPPVVSVLQAGNSLSTRIALFTAALSYQGAPSTQTRDGAVFLDILSDEGYDATQINDLITDLAVTFGLVPSGMADEIKTAMRASVNDTVGTLVHMLSNVGGQAAVEMEDDAGAREARPR